MNWFQFVFEGDESAEGHSNRDQIVGYGSWGTVQQVQYLTKILAETATETEKPSGHVDADWSEIGLIMVLLQFLI